MNHQARPIYWISSGFAASATTAMFLPRLVAKGQPDEGFAGATLVALVFLACAALAAALAITALVMTLRRRRSLSRGALFVGLAPLPLTVLGAIVFWSLVQRTADEGSAPDRRPTTVPAPR